MEVFSIETAGYKEFWFGSAGLIFVFVGLIGWFANGHAQDNPKIRFIFRAFLPFGLLWSSIAYYSTYSDYRELRDSFRSGKCNEIRGHIENFNHKHSRYATFSVGDTQFEINEKIVRAGFNKVDDIPKPASLVTIKACGDAIAYLFVHK